ncbi:hypothetical protein [Streptomyces capparidis]
MDAGWPVGGWYPKPIDALDGRKRSWAWLLGAREIDEAEDAPSRFTPFLKDWDAQFAVCEKWAARRGYAKPGCTVWSVLRPGDAEDLLGHLRHKRVEVLIVPGPRARERMRECWDGFDGIVAALGAAGIAVETADPMGADER